MTQASMFGPWFNGWGCGTQGWRGGGRRKAEGAEVIHDGGAHRDSKLSTQRDSSALISRLWMHLWRLGEDL